MCPDCSPPKLYPLLSISSKTYLSPTFVCTKFNFSFSAYLFNPKLLITVATIVFLFNFPFCFKYLEIIAINLSPSISSPFSSTARHLSPSPSYAIPKLILFLITYSFNISRCVEPHPAFILTPFGSLFIITWLIPRVENTLSATWYVAPFAVSITTLKSGLLNFSILSSKFFLKKYTYSSIKSVLTSETPIFSLTAVNSLSFPDSITSSISSSKLSGIFIPLLLKYFIPLNSNVLCDAEITTLASAWNFLVKYATPGVGITPNNLTFAP